METLDERNEEHPPVIERPGVPETVSKIFRYTEMEGVLEKVFVDHVAKPRRAYPTGEYYEVMEEGDDPEEFETVMVTDPKNFALMRYKRISDIPDDCLLPPHEIRGPSGG